MFGLFLILYKIKKKNIINVINVIRWVTKIYIRNQGQIKLSVHGPRQNRSVGDVGAFARAIGPLEFSRSSGQTINKAAFTMLYVLTIELKNIRESHP